MSLLLFDLPIGSTPTIFLLDPVTLEQVGELAGYPAVNVEVDGDPSRWYTADVDDLAAGRYLVVSQDPDGTGWVDTSVGSSPFPVTDGILSRLNISWIGGLPVVVGDVRVSLVSRISRHNGRLPIYFGEDHLAAESRELTIDGIVDDLTDATGKLTIKDRDGNIVEGFDHLSSSSVDNVEKRIKFEADADATSVFDLEKDYFFFCQAEYGNGHRITVKRGPVDIFDSAESAVPN